MIMTMDFAMDMGAGGTAQTGAGIIARMGRMGGNGVDATSADASKTVAGGKPPAGSISLDGAAQGGNGGVASDGSGTRGGNGYVLIIY